MGGTPKDWFGTTMTEDGEPVTTVDDDPAIASGPDSGLDLVATGTFNAVLLEGSLLGRYVLETRLGEGAMGQVWRARDPQLDRAVAIKVVHPAIARSPDGAARLLREARAMAKLSHRNVVAVFDAGDVRGQLFVAMELVEGLTLGDVLRGGGTRYWRRALALFLEAGRGLAAAHAAGVLHRDFKPDNVLVDRTGRVCVGDFGLAAFGGAGAHRPADRDAEVDALTAAGTVMGTPAYMSPEQLHGLPIDERADQFAFCVALYEALYGEHPFFGENPGLIGALLGAIEGNQIRPAPRGDEVPRALRTAVVRGLAAAPADRWPSMQALLAALAAATPRRIPPIVIGATAAAVVAVVLAVIVVVRADREVRKVRAEPPAALVPLRRFDVSLVTRIALSPDGERLAMGTVDRFEVRDLDTGAAWTHFDPGMIKLARLQFEGPDQVRFSYGPPATLATWTLSSGAVEPIGPLVGWAEWLGTLDGGELGVRQASAADASGYEIGVGDDVLVRLPRPPPVVALSPDRRRAALIDEGRYDGRIIVIDRRGVVLRSPPLPALTAVAWMSDGELVYATGTVDQPTLWVAPLVERALGPARVLYRASRGWFGQLVAGGGRLLYIDSGATFRGRVIDRAGAERSVRDLDTGTVGAVLGWLDDGSYLVWSRGSGVLERHRGQGPVAATPAHADGEPANATRAGDIVILAVRRDDGRELVALSYTDGRERWRRPAGTARAVRCAGDRAPPCVVVVEGGELEHQLRAIDPETGVEGAVVGPAGRVDDAALSDDGCELLIADGTGVVRRVVVATGATTEIRTDVAARGVAFDPRGGVLIAGTAGSAQYQVLRVDGAEVEVLLQSRNELLYLPRPSPDGTSVLAMGRLFLPAVYELPRR